MSGRGSLGNAVSFHCAKPSGVPKNAAYTNLHRPIEPERYPVEDDAGVKSRIVVVLGGLKKANPGKALEIVLDAAASDDTYLRSTTIASLLLFAGKPEAVEWLHKALLDSESVVRLTALRRLLDVPAAHEKALATVEKSQDATLRRTLAQELQRQPRVKKPAAVKHAVAILADLAADRKVPSLDCGDGEPAAIRSLVVRPRLATGAFPLARRRIAAQRDISMALVSNCRPLATIS